ncbi:MAG TPA: MMPL family transporter, partial [Burkholderiaceae bacterium]|nr:MMPL family transporter [Burkholderiaceae bacterium]
MTAQVGRRGPSPVQRLGGWLVAMAVLLVVIAHARFSTDLSVFLPRVPDGTERLLAEQLRDGVAARTLLLGVEGGDAAGRATALRSMARAMRASGAFEQVQDGEPEGRRAVEDWVLAHRYVLSAGMTPARFTSEGLHDALLDTLVHAGDFGSAMPAAFLARDPTGETLRIARDLAPAQAPRIEQGVWVSRLHPRAVLLATLRAPGADLDAQATALAVVARAFEPAAARGLRLLESGSPVFAQASRARIEHEAMLLGGLGLAAVGMLLLATFASPRALLASMLPVATGVVAGIAVTALAFGEVHGLTLAFGTALIGESVDYAIYFLIQARAHGWQSWVRTSWPTVRLGLATSVCGFAVLVASGFPGLAQLGVFSVSGLVAAALATRWVLPAILPHGAPGRGLRRRLGRAAARLVALAPRVRVALLVAGVAGVAMAMAAPGRLWRGDLAMLSPISPAEQVLDASLRADVGAADARTLVVAQGIDREGALRAAEAAASVLDTLVDAGELAGYDSPARLSPSMEEQARRLAALPDAATLRARLGIATRATPLDAQGLEPFVDDARAARDAGPLTAADSSRSPWAAWLDGMLFQRSGGGYAALLPLQAGPSGIEADVVRRALDHAHVH